MAGQANTVSVGAAGAERRVVNLAPGTLAPGSTDAVNGGQLHATNQQVSVLSSTVLGLRSSLEDGTIGLAQQDPASRVITIGAATNGGVLDVVGRAGNRRIAGVAAASAGTDAVNLDQLNAAVAAVATPAVGAGLPLTAGNQTGLGAPGATGRDALAAGYGASATASRAVALGNGSVADQADTVSVGRAGGERRIVNVAAGSIAAGSTDAVNGGQLSRAGAQVAAALGGGAGVDAGGGWTGPAYTIRGSRYADVGRALAAIDVDLARGADDVSALTRQVAALKAAGPPGATVPGVGSGGGSPGVPTTGGGTPTTGPTLPGTGGPGTPTTGGGTLPGGGAPGAPTIGGTGRITGVADGIAANDAVNLGQLTAASQALDARMQDFPVRANNTRGAPRPTATGGNAYASGYGAAATGDASVAIGGSARATSLEATAIGHESVAGAARSTAVGAASTASGVDSAAYGQGSRATAAAATAIGTGAQATYDGATAIGYGALAIADPTTAVGYRAVASGNEASAFGALASATADDATALGRSASATGAGATAVGVGAGARAAGSVALGQGAQAAQENAVAVGRGVATTRRNQVALGRSDQTYTLAGLGSAQSAAAQSGATGFVTTDAAGNLAASGYGPASLEAMGGRIGGLETSVAGLQAATTALRRDLRGAFQGTAIALALTGAVLPEGKSYAVSANFGTYRGETAFGASGTARISDNLYASGGVGFTASERSSVGGRGGLTLAW